MTGASTEEPSNCEAASSPTKESKSSNSEVKTSPSKKDIDIATQALNHFAQGKRHLLVSDISSAVNSLQEACRLLAEHYGETAPECGDAYFYYGKALLELARIENGVLGNALDGVPEGEDENNSQVEDPEKLTEEEKDMVSEIVGDALEENYKESEQKKPTPSKEDSSNSKDLDKAEKDSLDGSKSSKVTVELKGGELDISAPSESSPKDTDAEKMEVEESNPENDKQMDKTSKSQSEDKEMMETDVETKDSLPVENMDTEDNKVLTVDKTEGKESECPNTFGDQADAAMTEENSEETSSKVEGKTDEASKVVADGELPKEEGHKETDAISTEEEKESGKDTSISKNEESEGVANGSDIKEESAKVISETKKEDPEDEAKESEGVAGASNLEKGEKSTSKEESSKTSSNEKLEVGKEKESNQKEESTEDEDGEDKAGDSQDEEEAEADTTQENGEPEGEKTESEEEDVSNLQLAWEMLELSKVIYTKQLETKPSMNLKIAQVYLKLGEVGLESENYTQSIADFQQCLDIQIKELSADDRCLAETYYQMGVAYSFSDDFDKAIASFGSAAKVIEDRITNLEKRKKEKSSWTEEQKKKDAAESKDPFYTEQAEIDELGNLLPEIKERIVDMEEMKKDSKEKLQKFKEATFASVLGGSKASEAESSGSLVGFSDAKVDETKPATNIAHLVRKKRKPEEEAEKEGAKKAKAENGEALKSPTSVNGSKLENGAATSCVEEPTGVEVKEVESSNVPENKNKVETVST